MAAGTEGQVTQSLGGSLTVHVGAMGLVRVSGLDADAVGREPVKMEAPEGETLEERMWAALRSCYDPEIPVNIVDLGLVYDTRFDTLDDGSSAIEVRMTLTAPGCGMGVVIAADAEDRLRSIEGVSRARVDIVWEPPWNPRMISPEGRSKLGID